VAGHSAVYAAGVSVPPTVNVEFAGVPKSTWNRQSGHVEAWPDIRNGAGAPAGGCVEPSRSAGSIASFALEKTEGSRVVTKVAGSPASIAARSNANGCGPRKAVPAALKTFIVM
jgi:hypothetical protein